MAYLLLVAGLAVILVSCEFFTNGVEWVGKRLKLSEGAVGSVLAAVGTALPETVVPLVAIFLMGGEAGHEVGVGAILGAPFMLATLGFMMVGLGGVIHARRGRRPSHMELTRDVIRRDLRYFFLSYPIAIAAAFSPWQWPKYALAAALMVWYVRYVLVYLRGRAPAAEGSLAPLRFMPRAKDGPPTWAAVAQVLVSTGAIIAGARVFVGGVDQVATAWGVPRQLLALIIAPVATELPEKFNSIIWMGRGRDTLALGNMTGAMVFQSCFPVGVGLCFTPWSLQPWREHMPALASVVLAVASGVWLWTWLWRMKRVPAAFFIGAGAPYLVFVVVVVFLHSRGVP
ncbi:MAG: sodium:calcium antiporter [Armatimonadota bacterium]